MFKVRGGKRARLGLGGRGTVRVRVGKTVGLDDAKGLGEGKGVGVRLGVGVG